jgi:hypothetical protein
MSKVLRTIAVVAGAVALVATGVGAFAGAAGIKGLATAATIGKIASVATVVGGVAGIGAQLTAPKPTARGSITQVILEAEPPRPYIMGETYFAGVMRHQVGYGATINKVPNPHLWEVVVYSGVSVDALVAPQFDFGTISSYYNTFYAYDDQLGAVPESTALVPPYGTAPGWTSASKMSGNAAIGWNFKFDKDGKRYASGRPVTGAIWRGVRVYDPRQDSTFPGGSGSCRLGNESTYVYLRNPACHAGTYAYGRYQLGKKVFGIGLTAEAIDFEAIAAWANDCDANEWYVDGVIFEGGSQGGSGIKARNLSDICVAGGGQWITSGGVLSFDWNRPRVSLDTITDADIMRAGGIDVIAVQPHRERFNTVRPQYTSPSHNWQLITANPIVGSTYVTEDGESKTQTWPLNLVKGTAQSGELASYALVDSREIGPFTINLPAVWRFYRPGDTLTLNSARLDYNGQIVIQRRTFNPSTLVTTLVVRSETPAKHDFALGKVAVPPPTPVLGQTGEQRDNVFAAFVEPTALDTLLISGSWTTDLDPADQLAQATNTTITVESHTRNYSDKQVSVNGGTITTEDDGVTALTASTLYHLYYDDGARVGGAVSYKATLSSSDAANSAINTSRHYCGSIFTDAPGGTGTTGGGVFPSGWFIDDWYGF